MMVERLEEEARNTLALNSAASWENSNRNGGGSGTGWASDKIARSDLENQGLPITSVKELETRSIPSKRKL